jgi:heme oxygenase
VRQKCQVVRRLGSRLSTVTQGVHCADADIGEAGLSTAARLLKERTADLHNRVETGLDLVDPGLDLVRLNAVLEHFHGFWSATEPVIDRWATANLAMAKALQWPRRRRTDLLRHDLAALAGHVGVATTEVLDTAPVFVECDDAAVLGWLYVSEGSTLGGAVIDRMLRPLIGRSGLRLRSFTPYDEGPGPMWRQYLAALEAWTGDDPDRTERVVDAGVQTFAALESWLAPLRRELAA